MLAKVILYTTSGLFGIRIKKGIFYMKTSISRITGCIPALTFLLCLFTAHSTRAATAPISETDKYAWTETSGWLNFRPTHGEVTVHDTHLAGFAWAENIGWVKLGADSGGPYGNSSANDWGVNRDGTGNLSGYAWSETAGWINFNPGHNQVTINLATGDFNGYAWGENIGYVHFNNAGPAYKVNVFIDSDGDGIPDSNDPCPNSDPPGSACVPSGSTAPVNPLPGVWITLPPINSGGVITAEATSNPSPPTNFRIPAGHLYYHVTFSGDLGGGAAKVCLKYTDSPNEQNYKVKHGVDSNNDQIVDFWEDLPTVSQDEDINIICVMTTSFSPFVVGEPDTDGDGIADSADNCLNTPNPTQTNSDNDALGNACDACPNDGNNDADGDGICGDWEDSHGLNPDDVADAQLDFDGDGLSNILEYLLGADPNLLDSDNDGHDDAHDSDPANDLTYLCMDAVKHRETGTAFASVADALVSGLILDNDTVMMSSPEHVEDLVFDQAMTVHLTGGYDCGFSNTIASTEISGSLTIRAGTAVVESITLK